MVQKNIITALDYAYAAAALRVADTIDPTLTRVKVGKELFTRAGPEVVRQLHDKDFDVFLDLKFHDIPNTVAGAVSAACDLGVWMVNIHTSGGQRMMEAAVKAVADSNTETMLIGVTILTSLTDEEIARVGFQKSAAEQAVHLAELAAESGLAGVVCSPQEVPNIKAAVASRNATFVTVTPGVRPTALITSDDQRRTMTPAEAVSNGSDYLVIGRPITQADNPNAALTSIINDMQSAV